MILLRMDLWAGRYNLPTDITAFPSDGYDGIVLERDIPIVSMCSHHHQAILGKAHIAYIPGEDGKLPPLRCCLVNCTFKK